MKTATGMASIEAWMTGVVSLRLSSMTQDEANELRQALSLYGRTPEDAGWVCFAHESGDWMHVPRGWYLTEGGKFPWMRRVAIREGRSDGYPMPPGTRVTKTLGIPPFPPDQPRFVADIVAGAQRTGIGGLALAPTRYGKTGCAISAAVALGGSTLVAVNTKLLAGQWLDAWAEWVVDAQGRPIPAGMIREGRFDLPPEHPFVVGMVQTLVRRRLDESVRGAFRTLIVEECDCIPTVMAMSVVQRFRPRFVIGLSATPDRKDGLGEAITWMVGPGIAHAKRVMEADVYFAHLPWKACKVPTKSGKRMRTPRVTRNGVTDIVDVEKALVRDEHRLDYIAGEAVRGCRDGRQVLILAGLRDHIRAIIERTQAAGCPDPRFLMGGATERDRMHGNPVVATYGSCAKGGDFRPPPTLLILASPRGDVRQAMGRALQPQAPCRPIILDLVDGHPRLVKMARDRLGIYRGHNLNVMNGVWNDG